MRWVFKLFPSWITPYLVEFCGMPIILTQTLKLWSMDTLLIFSKVKINIKIFSTITFLCPFSLNWVAMYICISIFTTLLRGGWFITGGLSKPEFHNTGTVEENLFEKRNLLCESRLAKRWRHEHGPDKLTHDVRREVSNFKAAKTATQLSGTPPMHCGHAGGPQVLA